jgi:hypothetical protein
MRFAETSSPGGSSTVDLLGARFISRLLLSFFIAHDALIGTMRRLRFRLGHALLATVPAALILRPFQIVFSRHGGPTFQFDDVAG